MVRRRLLIIMCLAALFAVRSAMAQTPTGCCKTTVGNCFPRTPSECPAPYTFISFGPGQTDCSQLAQCAGSVTPASGCCAPSTDGSCLDSSTDSVCPPPSILYPSKQCSEIAACQVAGKCEKAATGDCLQMKRWECGQKAADGYVFAAGGTCASVTSTTSSKNETTSSEDKPLVFTPEIPLPTFTGGPVTGAMIAEYIRAVYIYLVWTVGILATVMVIWGGIKWVAAAGNPTRIADARDTINNAIIGVIIALTSVLLLALINPDLVKLRSVSPGSIEPQLLQVIKAIETEAGELTRCDKTQVAGEPSKVCSGRHPVYNPNHPLSFECSDLNSKVNNVAQNYQSSGLDHFMLKAIIMIESPKVDGQPYSGPEAKNGPGYGIGQFKMATLLEVLAKVNVGGIGSVGLPPPCKEDKAYAADGVHISDSCKEWLDRQHYVGLGGAGIDAQVRMIAYYFNQQLQDQKCVKGNPLLAAAAYNRGLGGATGSFCDPSAYKGTTDLQTVRAKALNYIAEFKKQYAAACAAGVQ